MTPVPDLSPGDRVTVVAAGPYQNWQGTVEAVEDTTVRARTDGGVLVRFNPQLLRLFNADDLEACE